MAIRRDRTQRDVETLGGQRGSPGDRAVLWKELDGLAEKIAQKLIGTKLADKLVGSASGRDLDGAVGNTDTIRDINQLIDSVNTFINNEADRLDGALDAETTVREGEIANVNVRVDQAEADITAETIARTDGDTAIASDVTAVTARVDQAEADITNESIARADADTALSQDISTVSANLSSAEAQVTESKNAIATIEGYQAATYTLRTVAGSATAELELVAADDPINGAASAVRMTADRILLDGTVYTQHLSAGAITAAKIGAGEVKANNIAAGAITADKIGAGEITADKIGAGEVTVDKLVIDNSTLDTDVNGNLTLKAGGVTSQILTTNAATKSESGTEPESGMGGLITVWITGLGGYPLLILANYTIKNVSTPGGSSNVYISCEVDGVELWKTNGSHFISTTTSVSGGQSVQLIANDANANGSPTVDDIELVVIELRR
ncbi:hypothetical protein [Sediminimonas sp.]|uniref:hypothetical protein n=1 Tax=Sediminimonas sp. TaxID=2823379 RepID=UPI0025DDB1B4|nr:hypothetical protein [Sediminimonas sp.]